MRKELKPRFDQKLNDVPDHFLEEVQRQVKDGYELCFISNNTVKLIKTKRYWFHLLFVPLLPYSINNIFSSSFLCTIYGIDLMLKGKHIHFSTF